LRVADLRPGMSKRSLREVGRAGSSANAGPARSGRKLIRVLIADDHDVVRKGLRQIISQTHDIVVAGEATNGQEALDMSLQGRFDVAVLDISMPDRQGFDVIRSLKTATPGLKVIMLSMHTEEQYALQSFRQGAFAYLAKTADSDELLKAIRTVAAGRKYVTATIAENLAARLEVDTRRPPIEQLSNRELQVLALLGSGKRPSDISRELALSIKTVSTYRTRILRKLGLESSGQLIRYALQNGLSP
jgi:two-component system, NarL family, invasion response regulator UvrY